MNPNSQEIVDRIGSHIETHPNATLKIISERLGMPLSEVEQALRDEGSSLDELRKSKRLEQAFTQLATCYTALTGPFEKKRSRTRRIIPRTTVRYRVQNLWLYQGSYSEACPLVDLSSGGLAFLCDVSPAPGKRVSLLITFPGGSEEVSVVGRIIYAVATGIAGYRYRIGIEFLPFDEKRGCNTLRTRDILIKFEESRL